MLWILDGEYYNQSWQPCIPAVAQNDPATLENDPASLVNAQVHSYQEYLFQGYNIYRGNQFSKTRIEGYALDKLSERKEETLKNQDGNQAEDKIAFKTKVLIMCKL